MIRAWKLALVPRMAVLMVAILAAAWGATTDTAHASSPAKPGYHLVNPGYLTVATYGTAKPDVILEPGGNLGGIDGYFMNQFVKDHHLKLKLFETNFSGAILAVQDHKADTAMDIFFTPIRAKSMYYAAPYIAAGTTVLMTHKSFHYTGPSSMTGKKVAGTIGEVWAPYLQKWSPSGAALYPTDTAAAQALLNGQASGYVNSVTALKDPPLAGTDVVAHKLKAGDFGFPNALIHNASYNIAACDNHGLAKALTQEMAKLHKNGSWAKYYKSNSLPKSMIAGTKPPPEGC